MKASLKRMICLALALSVIATSALADFETLKKGMKGDNVQSMQMALAALGYDVTADGIFGAGTEKIVKQFQKDQDLTADGKAGNKTLTRLYDLLPNYMPDNQKGSTSQSSSSASQTSTLLPVSMRARVQTTGGTLTLRKTESTSATALKYIPNLTVLDILEKGSKWCKAEYEGKTGYVLTSYLNFNIEGTETAPTQETTQRTDTTTGTQYATVKTTGGTLTLRKTESTSATALKYIPNKTVITVLEKGSKWCKAEYDGKTGYVLTSYLVFGAAEPVYEEPEETPEVTVSGTQYATVKTSGGTLTLRKTESTSATALKYIPNQTVITVLEKGSKWCKAEYDGKTGYVLTSYLVFGASEPTEKTQEIEPETPAQTEPEVQYATVKTSGGTLTLRKTESTSASALKFIPNQTVIAILEKGSKWCKAEYDGKTGYVLTSYLVFGASAPTDPSAEISEDLDEPDGPDPETPAQTVEESTYDKTVLTRTLRSGYTGNDVTMVQERLKALNYLSKVSGVYDEETIEAVTRFQSVHGLTADGLAGNATFTVLFSSGAITYSTDIENYTTMHIYYRTSIPDAMLVTQMQTRLKELGYSVTVNGSFDESTHNAIVQFQMRNNLSTDGVAGKSTQTVLYSSAAKGYSATPSLVLSDSDGRMTAPKTSQIQLLHWYNVVKPSLGSGAKLLIYDPDTGLSWTLKVYAKGHHADCEPLTLKDTLLMNKSFGKTSWTVQTVYVQLPDGRWTMATMHNRPHLSGSISNNGFDGHLCVHFLRDLSECKANDPDYGMQNQNTLRSSWKALTGETVN